MTVDPHWFFVEKPSSVFKPRLDFVAEVWNEIKTVICLTQRESQAGFALKMTTTKNVKERRQLLLWTDPFWGRRWCGDRGNWKIWAVDFNPYSDLCEEIRPAYEGRRWEAVDIGANRKEEQELKANQLSIYSGDGQRWLSRVSWSNGILLVQCMLTWEKELKVN